VVLEQERQRQRHGQTGGVLDGVRGHRVLGDSESFFVKSADGHAAQSANCGQHPEHG
jgi:hypothetical protein